MTNRQKRILEMVRPHLSDVYLTATKELSDQPFGWSLLVRVPRPFVPYSSQSGYLPVHILKDTDGFKFRVDESLFWHRKGRTAPKWRKLQPSSRHQAGA